MNNEECRNVISASWTGNDACSMMKKMYRCGQALVCWGVNHTGQFKRRLKFHKEKIVRSMQGRGRVILNFSKQEMSIMIFLTNKKFIGNRRLRPFGSKMGIRIQNTFMPKLLIGGRIIVLQN